MPNPNRGQPNYRGRGSNRSRGRGGRGGGGGGGGFRGGFRGNFRGRGRGSGLGYTQSDEIDFVVQQWRDETDSNVPNFPARGRMNNRGGPFTPGSGTRTPNSKPNSTPNSGTNTPRGRGRGRVRGQGQDATDQYSSGRGRGTFDQSPSYRGGGRGGLQLRPDAPLSKLLWQERPLLKPIVFVRSVYTATLFEEQDEVFKPIVESAGNEEASHVPTADRVARIFSGNVPTYGNNDDDEGSAQEPEELLEEIDFNDLGKLAEITTVAAGQSDMEIVEEKFTGIRMISEPTVTQDTETISGAVALSQKSYSFEELHETRKQDTIVMPAASTSEGDSMIDIVPPTVEKLGSSIAPFFVDSGPAQASAPVENEVMYDRAVDSTPLGEQFGPDEEEIIVYVAPHPRTSQQNPSAAVPPTTPPQEQVTQHSGVEVPDMPTATLATTFKTNPIIENFSFSPSPRKQPRQVPVFTAGARAKAAVKVRVHQARVAKRRAQRSGGFGLFGAMLSEAQLQGRDPRWEERRRGDSDVDWGDSNSDEDGDNVKKDSIAEVEKGVGAMDLDPDLELDIGVLKAFVKGMSACGSQHVTMDDIADEERMRAEDEDGMGNESAASEDNQDDDASDTDEEGDALVNAEENLLVGEPGGFDLAESDDDDDDDSSDDDYASPGRGFQARLERLRAKSNGKQRAEVSGDEDSGSDDDMHMGWRADEDEEYLAHIEALLDENEQILSRAQRKERNRLFRAIQDGDFEDIVDASLPLRNKDKGKLLPPHLLEQWEKDRAKKAENKAKRLQARLELAADPLSIKKGGKKGRKAMLAAARLDPSIKSLPNRVVDMADVERQIRRFLGALGGPSTMSLPPMDKGARKSVHEMALAFNLKSISKGKGDCRYTTLQKTTRSGVGINERKVARIIRQWGGQPMGGPFEGRGGGRGGAGVPKHREGDEVGKAAPKIGESNLGFKMLAAMGWSEGDRIGASGGLDVPLTAIIKNSKLGLGALK